MSGSWPYRLAMATIVAGCVTLGAVLTYLFWPVRVVYVSEPMPVWPSTVRAGEWLQLTVRYDKPFEHESLVGVMFASRGRVGLSPVGLSALPTGQHQIEFYVQVPPPLPPGRYTALLIVERQVRLPLPAVFDRPVTAVSEPFEVVR